MKRQTHDSLPPERAATSGRRLILWLSVTVAAVLLLNIATYVPKAKFAFSEESCDYLVPVDIEQVVRGGFYDAQDAIANNRDCKRMVRDRETLFTFFREREPTREEIAPKDSECESEAKSSMRRICYFRKALDSGNANFCDNIESYSGTRQCIANLAAVLGDESICDELHQLNRKPDPKYAESCLNKVGDCKSDVPIDPAWCRPINAFSCNRYALSDSPEIAALYPRCIEKYGDVS